MSPQFQRPRKERPSRKRQPCESEILVDRILEEGAAKAAAVAAALTVTNSSLTEDELRNWHRDMIRRLQQIHQHPEQNLGFVEEEVARSSRELQRLLCERAAQAKANATPLECREHHIPLRHIQFLRRSIDSRSAP